MRFRKTFSYVDGQPKGLLENKKVYIAIASGGIYSEGPLQSLDFAAPYLKTILSFIGLIDITVYRVESVNIPGLQEAALKKGLLSIAV